MELALSQSASKKKKKIVLSKGAEDKDQRPEKQSTSKKKTGRC